jgi:hypothetical protein
MIPEETRKEIKSVIALRSANDAMIRAAHKYVDDAPVGFIVPLTINSKAFYRMFNNYLSQYTKEDIMELVRELNEELLQEQMS